MINLLELTGRPKTKLAQKVLNISEAPEAKLKWPMMASEKIDGVFCFALKEATKTHDEVNIYSRTGESYVSMGHLEERLKPFLKYGEVLIFEAFIPGVDQATVSGAARDTKQNHMELCCYAHDLLTESEFIYGGGRPYKERWELLFNAWMFQRLKLDLRQITVAKHVVMAQSLEDAMSWARGIWELDGEGLVLRNPEAPYEPGKRTPNMVKIKQGVSYDLRVVSVYEGKGKYAGTLGGLIVAFRGGEILKISGMTDAQRKEWWEDPSKILGKIVQVDAMAESSKGKLREPRFKGIRFDKTEADF